MLKIIKTLAKSAMLKDSFVYLAGELLSKIMPFLLLPYLSRKLGVEGYGELSYYQTYLALFGIVIGMSQEGAVTRYFYFYGKKSINLIVNAGYLLALVTGLIIAILCLLMHSQILFYCAISCIFSVLVSVQLSVRQCQKQSIKYTTIQILSTFASTLITLGMLEFYKTNLAEKRILATLLANIIVFGIAYLLYRKQENIQKKYSIRQYKLALIYIFSFGLPLILHHLSIFTKGQMDRIFIYHQFDKKSLGLYAMGATLASLLSVGIMAINKATVPYYFEALKQQKLTLVKLKMWTKLSLIAVPIPSIIIWLIPEKFLLFLLGDQFVGVKYFFSVFLLSTTLVIPYLLLVNYLFFYGKNKQISMCSILSALIYLFSLMLLLNTTLSLLPFASVIGAVAILPILWFMASNVEKNRNGNSLIS